jgi:DNA-binding MarR family transcriptional regulator
VPRASREDLGYLLAKASQRFNERLQEAFAAAGFPEVRASYGSVLVPLLEEDGLRMGEIARRARLSKQTMTTMVGLCERDGLVERRADPDDRRAKTVQLTAKAESFRPVVERVLGALERKHRRQLGNERFRELTEILKELS